MQFISIIDRIADEGVNEDEGINEGINELESLILTFVYSLISDSVYY